MVVTVVSVVLVKGGSAEMVAIPDTIKMLATRMIKLIFTQQWMLTARVNLLLSAYHTVNINSE